MSFIATFLGLSQIKEVRINMQTMSSIRRDFIATHLRSQLNRLRRFLDNIEEEERLDPGYADEALKEVEVGLRRIRKLCMSNN